MVNFKEKISEELEKIININKKELETYIETPKDTKNGDYSFPCFRLAKELKKAPQIIANEIKEKINLENTGIEKVEVIGGFLNFFIDKEVLIKEVLEGFEKQEYKNLKIGEGKNIVIDYSAPNIAKPFHIGHLRTTVIGGALSNIYKFLGYNVTGVNHLGDYGTQFGKLIGGYKLWGDEYDIDKDPINELTKIYIRINDLCKKDEKVLEECRNNFKKLEEGDPYCVELWKKFREVSLKEFQRVYDESQGAKVVDLTDQGIDTPCIIIKSNGSSTYATRDLAAILYRARTYDFDKAIYVTSYEQILHFKQIFATAKYLGLDEKYTNGLIHVPFGMVLLPTGKMSTREGTSIKLEDLLNEAIERAKKIIEDKNPELEDKDLIAKKVGVGAVIFNDLTNNRVTDEIFDWDTLLNVQGETGPYVQYTYVRTQSILRKAENVPSFRDVNIEKIDDNYSVNILKLIYDFEDILVEVTKKEEPSILSRYLIDLAKAFSNFYNENKIIGEEKEIENARLYLTKVVGEILKTGASLLGIEMPDKM